MNKILLPFPQKKDQIERDLFRNKFGVPGVYDEFIGKMTTLGIWVARPRLDSQARKLMPPSFLGSPRASVHRGEEHFGFLIKCRMEFRQVELPIETAEHLR